MTDPSLTLSLVDLSRQVGSTLHRTLTWEAPEDLGTSSMWVEPGTPLVLEVDLTSVDGGVLVDLATDVDLVGECVRCLEPVLAHHHVTAEDVYLEPSPDAHRPVPPDDEEADDELLLIGPHDTVDLEPVVRDAVVPLVDERPLCRPDCPGLCPVCGERWDDLPEDHDHDVVDPRLAGLAALLGTDDREVVDEGAAGAAGHPGGDDAVGAGEDA